jgi:hypothetical protein
MADNDVPRRSFKGRSAPARSLQRAATGAASGRLRRNQPQLRPQ